MKIIIIAEVPDELGNTFCQHVCGFGITHPGCRLDIFAVDPNKTKEEIGEILNIKPLDENKS